MSSMLIDMGGLEAGRLDSAGTGDSCRGDGGWSKNSGKIPAPRGSSPSGEEQGDGDGDDNGTSDNGTSGDEGPDRDVLIASRCWAVGRTGFKITLDYIKKAKKAARLEVMAERAQTEMWRARVLANKPLPNSLHLPPSPSPTIWHWVQVPPAAPPHLFYPNPPPCLGDPQNEDVNQASKHIARAMAASPKGPTRSYNSRRRCFTVIIQTRRQVFPPRLHNLTIRVRLRDPTLCDDTKMLSRELTDAHTALDFVASLSERPVGSCGTPNLCIKPRARSKHRSQPRSSPRPDSTRRPRRRQPEPSRERDHHSSHDHHSYDLLGACREFYVYLAILYFSSLLHHTPKAREELAGRRRLTSNSPRSIKLPNSALQLLTGCPLEEERRDAGAARTFGRRDGSSCICTVFCMSIRKNPN
ncbi:hypothetical protein C8R43DRAFT_944167 [Mycena crocata]|nr:hypothetical protein C8R43DRAFT_944167 [Mycena crocata]